jgi:aarF domain-containing kinase
MFNVLPKGLFIEETMAAAKEELAIECDYLHEAKCQKQFKANFLCDPTVYVPEVIDQLSTKRILTSEMVSGLPIDRIALGSQFALSQDERNRLASTLLTVCLKELFVHRFMQTDPNWSNFLYDPKTQKLNLIDFGATRDYRKEFVDEYLRMVHACAERDREGVIQSSIRMGFLTGDESKEMLNAHVEAAFIVGEPFHERGVYDFVNTDMAGRVSRLAAVMLKFRLTPPPKEAYTLHRKLSGCFLTCKKLGAVIHCREQFMDVYRNHKFDPIDESKPVYLVKEKIDIDIK